MVFTDISIFERLGRRNANIASGLAISLLLLVFLFKLPFTPEIPKDGEQGGGITVALGWPDAGSFNDTPSAGGGEPIPPVEQSKSTYVPPSNTPASTGEITSEDKEVDYAAEARKKEEVQRKLKEIEDATKRRREEALAATLEQRRIEEEEAAKQRAAKAYADAKAGFGKFMNSGVTGGTGKGSGNNNKSGNGGSKDGDPNTSNLEGGGTGNGKGGGVGALIGGGIGNRGVLTSAAPRNNYNESGDVVVNVCVFANGQVNPSSVKVSIKGTNTNSEVLRNIAKENAKTYRFKEGSEDDCGTITYRFRVK